MKRLLVLAAFAAMSAVCTNTSAQTTRVLIPIAVRAVPGAYGSIWTSHLWVHNGDGVQRTFDTELICPIECFDFLGANQTLNDAPVIAQPGGNPGLFALDSTSDAVRFHLRVQDESREAETWGTDIPVVRESDALTGRIYLQDVPTDPQFRVYLRVYSFDSSTPGSVHVRAFDPLRFNEDLGSADLNLSAPTGYINTKAKYKPAYADIADLVAAIPGVAKVPQFVLELTPSSPDLRYWAFISVTHDSTQHFTVIAP